MIRINLAPVDELESRFFYAPELAVLLVLSIAGYFGVDHYLQDVRDEIASLNQQEQVKRTAIDKLKADLQRYENLNTNIADLNQKLAALKKITVSRIAKYKPVIALEHLQNLKPEGVWFTAISNSGLNMTLAGAAFDNILLAEFLMALRSTGSQEADPADLRTQVYFDDIDLTFSKLGNDSDFVELTNYPAFQLTMSYKEKDVGAGEAAMPPGAVSANGPGSGGVF